MKLYLLIPILIFLFFVGCLYIQFNQPKNLNKIIDETAISWNQKLSDKTNKFCDKYPLLDFRDISFKWNFEPIEKDKWSQKPIRRTDFSIKSFNSLGN